MPSLLAGMRPAFVFASHATAFLHHRLSGDLLLALGGVHHVDTSGQRLDILEFLAGLRRLGQPMVGFVPLAPGDQQDLHGVSGHPALAVTSTGQMLAIADEDAVLVGTTSAPRVHDLRSAQRELHHGVEELSRALGEERHLLINARDLPSPLVLPSAFSAVARQITATASTVLALGEVVRSEAIVRERASLDAVHLLSEVERAARRALAAVISDRTLTDPIAARD